MPRHHHTFANTYAGMLALGLDRETDEHTVWALLQKLSDDELMQALLPRLADTELQTVFEQVYALIKSHLNDEEYHQLFLKDHEDVT